MPKPTKGELFVNEIVIGCGVVGGIFAKAGIDPEGSIISGLLKAISNFLPPEYVLLLALVFSIIGLIGTIAPWFESFDFGGVSGLIALGLGWLAGFLLPSSVGAILLVIAIGLGYFIGDIM